MLPLGFNQGSKWGQGDGSIFKVPVMQEWGLRAGDMARRLRALVALAEDLGSVSSTYMVTPNRL